MAKRLQRHDAAREAAITLIGRIADRAVLLYSDHHVCPDRLAIVLDITICHFTAGQRLRLDDLLAADDLNFIHDVAGINKRLDRETGLLRDGFRPRFSA